MSGPVHMYMYICIYPAYICTHIIHIYMCIYLYISTYVVHKHYTSIINRKIQLLKLYFSSHSLTIHLLQLTVVLLKYYVTGPAAPPAFKHCIHSVHSVTRLANGYVCICIYMHVYFYMYIRADLNVPMLYLTYMMHGVVIIITTTLK